MNSGTKKPRRSDKHEKDRAFLAGLKSAPLETLKRQRRHYKNQPWRVVAIDRELTRRA